MKKLLWMIVLILMLAVPTMADTVDVRLGWQQVITSDFAGWGLYQSITEITPVNCHDGVETTIIDYSGTPSDDYTTDTQITSPDGVVTTHYFCLDARDIAGNMSDCACISTDIDLNDSPVANAGGPYAGLVNETIHFDGSGSSDIDGSIISYSWNFGDGGSGAGMNTAYSYMVTGTYTVTLTVTDNGGKTNTATVVVNITEDITPPAEPQSLTIEVITP